MANAETYIEDNGTDNLVTVGGLSYPYRSTDAVKLIKAIPSLGLKNEYGIVMIDTLNPDMISQAAKMLDSGSASWEVESFLSNPASAVSGTGSIAEFNEGGYTGLWNPQTGEIYTVDQSGGGTQYLDLGGSQPSQEDFSDWLNDPNTKQMFMNTRPEGGGTWDRLNMYDAYLSSLEGSSGSGDYGMYYNWALTQFPASVVENMSPDEVFSMYMQAHPEEADGMSEYESAMLDYYNAQLAEDRRQAEENMRWQMAQSPNSPQPSGFAGWGNEYEWSPSAYMSGGNGWMTSPMSMEEMNNPYMYGSSAWAQAAANWWDVSRINRTLEEAGNPDMMQYTGMVPGVVSQYFQGIEPYMYARDINSNMTGDPYQLSSMPSWGDIQSWTTPQLQQMQSAFENLHTQYTWEDMLKTSYAQAPPGGSGFKGLNYY